MFVTIDHQPFHLLDAALMKQLDDLALRLIEDSSIQVVVFDSADADFFLAHGDMNFVKDPAAFMALELGDKANAHLNPMMALLERYRTLPQVTIGKLKGLARCGGVEFLTALDMRFAATETAGLGQTETLMAIIPGAGGTAYLPPLLGRARSLEVIVGADLIDAPTAERYGWINRALPALELDSFVESLALRIGKLAPGIVKAAKIAVDAGVNLPVEEALKVGNEQLGEVFSKPIAVERALEALNRGAQTREVEKKLEDLFQSF